MSHRKKDSNRSRRIRAGQPGLFGEGAWSGLEDGSVVQERGGGQGRRIFLNPNPRGIWIGRKSLEDHLHGCREPGAFAVRELIQGMSWERFENRYRGGGRPGYHPAVMVSLILFGILEGKSSLRELETLGCMDARCWWLTGGVHPDHSVICRFLMLHGEDLTESYFEDLTKEVIRRLGGSGGTVSGDGTVIQAAASRYRRLQAEVALEQAQETARQAKAALEQAAEAGQQGEEKELENQKLKRQVEKSVELVELIEKRQEARRANRYKGELQISATEPEAAIQPLKSKEYRPSYRPSILAREDRVVVAKGVHATSEVEVVAGMLEQAKRVNGAPEVLLLDAGYFHEKVLELGVTDPDLKHLLCPEGKTIGDGSWERKSRGEVPKSAFVYEEWQDRYRCPGGRYLYPRQESCTDRGKGYVVYRCADCGSCEKKGQCVPKKRNCRELKRYEDEELKEAMREVMRQPRARSLYRRRQGMVEPVFAELQGVQGLRRFRRFGVRAVSLEFSLHVMAHNLRRLIKLTAKAASRSLCTPSGLLKRLFDRLSDCLAVWPRFRYAWRG
jgi:transposase